MRDGLLMPLLGLLLIGGLVLLVGCESEETAPNDPLPTLTQEDAAGQAAIPAVAMSSVGPALAGFSGGNVISKTRYSYDFEDEFTGTVYFDFLSGGAEGEPADWDDADYGRMWTEDEPVSLNVGDLEVTFLMAITEVVGFPYDPGAQTATLNGTGSITIGDFDYAWEIVDVDVTADGFPDDGVLTFTTDEYDVEVHYDGDSTADVYVDEEYMGTINLGNGSFQEI